MFTITKDFAFSYSHQLLHLPPDHQCFRLHGHNAVVRVFLASNVVDADGFVLDYGLMKPLDRYIKQELDHRHLNDVFDFYPTSELLSEFLYKKIRDEWFWPVTMVGWSETPKTWAYYCPNTGPFPSQP